MRPLLLREVKIVVYSEELIKTILKLNVSKKRENNVKLDLEE